MTPSETLILGLESSCDETAASVVRDGRDVLSNVIATQTELHTDFGGVVPEIASRAHIERILPVIEMAISEAGLALATDVRRISAIAVGNRPGLIGSLLVAVAAAKALAWVWDKPLIGIDHIVAHLHAGSLGVEQPRFPALGLVVSGGHTNMFTMRSPLELSSLGRTIDDAIGEAFDKAALMLGLGFPGGPSLDRRAAQGDSQSVRFPVSMLGQCSLDFSFSGLKTALLYEVRGLPEGRGRDATFARSAEDLSEKRVSDLCASFQHAAIEAIIRKLDRALSVLQDRSEPPHTLIIGGGVSANSLLRARAADFARERHLDLRIPRLPYCVDNAAMIAGLAFHHLRAGRTDPLSLTATPAGTF